MTTGMIAGLCWLRVRRRVLSRRNLHLRQLATGHVELPSHEH